MFQKTGPSPITSHYGLELLSQPGEATNSNQLWGAVNLPKGVGKNGIVFETARPDDPENYA
jgi:hypothetical protein